MREGGGRREEGGGRESRCGLGVLRGGLVVFASHPRCNGSVTMDSSPVASPRSNCSDRRGDPGSLSERLGGDRPQR